jgi:AAA family ATP:ADP antiporter
MFRPWLRVRAASRDGDQANRVARHGDDQAAPLVVRTVLMSVQILGIVTAFTLTKAVRDAVFLSHFRMQDLALVSLLLTSLSTIAVAAHQRWVATRFSRGGAAVASLLTVGVSLVAFQFAIRAQQPWAAWGLYLWSGVFGLFLVAQFWIMALEVFDPREARRAFPIAAGGASLGGVFGGALADGMSESLSEASMLLVVALVLALCAGAAALAWSMRPRDVHPARASHLPPATRDPPAGWRSLAAHPLLRTAGVILLCSSIAGTLLDWQVKAIAKAVFHSHREEMTEFFGRVLAVSSIAALVLQLATTRVLKRFGVARGLLALPGVMLVGAALFALQPALGASLVSVAVIARTAEMGTRYAIDKPALELLYMPIEGHLRAAAKSWLDTLADRVGGAVTALIWLLLQFAFDIEEPSRVRIASVVVAAITAVWITVALRARQSHLAAFRVALSRGETDYTARTRGVLDREAIAMVRQAVENGSTPEVQVALEIIAEAPGHAGAVDVTPLLQHPRAPIRARAVDVLRLRRTLPRTAQIAALLSDPAIAVRVAALEWILAIGVDRMLLDANHPVPVNVRDLLAWARESPPRRAAMVRDLAASPEPARRAMAAVMAANLADTVLLRRLCDDPEPSVVAAALGAMRPPRTDEEIALLLRLGVRAGARAHAVERLARAPLRRLRHAWANASEPGVIGLLCDAIAHSHEPGASELLAASSARVDGVVRRRAWRDLALRRADGDEGPSTETIEALFAAQIERLRDRALARNALETHRHDPVKALLARALDESLDRETAALFDLLALVAPPREVREAHLWLRDAPPRTRATCIEFLDNALPSAMRARVMPWLEPNDAAERRRRLAAVDGERAMPALEDALGSLARCDEGWLRALATDALSRQGLRASQLPRRDGERDARVEHVLADRIGAAIPWPT